MAECEKAFEVGKILLDKGIIGAAIVWLGWRVTRAVEELKSSLAWRTELSRERLRAAKRLHACASALIDTTWQLIIESLLPDQERAELPTRYQTESTELERAVAEESIVLPEPVASLFHELSKAADEAAQSIRENSEDWHPRLKTLEGLLQEAVRRIRSLVETQWGAGHQG